MRTFIAIVILSVLRYFGIAYNAFFLILPMLFLLAMDFLDLGKMAKKIN